MIYLGNVFIITPLSVDNCVDNYKESEDILFLEKAMDKTDDVHLINNLIYVDEKLYVPVNKRELILEESHDSNIACHGGVDATLNRMKSFFWPKMIDDTKEFVTSCTTCQKRKAETRIPTGDMYHHEVHEPGAQVAVDYLRPLPASLSHKHYVLVAIDVFTSFIDAVAVPDLSAKHFV